MPPQFKDGNICQLLMNYVMMMNATHPETDITITDEGAMTGLRCRQNTDSNFTA